MKLRILRTFVATALFVLAQSPQPAQAQLGVGGAAGAGAVAGAGAAATTTTEATTEAAAATEIAATTTTTDTTPPTTVWVTQTIGNTYTVVPSIFTQQFSHMYTSLYSPSSGSIGMGTETGQIGVVRSGVGRGAITPGERGWLLAVVVGAAGAAVGGGALLI